LRLELGQMLAVRNRFGYLQASRVAKMASPDEKEGTFISENERPFLMLGRQDGY
jgi:hypothetical protein